MKNASKFLLRGNSSVQKTHTFQLISYFYPLKNMQVHSPGTHSHQSNETKPQISIKSWKQLQTIYTRSYCVGKITCSCVL